MLIRDGGVEVSVEVAAARRDDATLENDRRAHDIFEWVLAMSAEHDVAIAGEIPAPITDGELRALSERIDAAARLIAAGRAPSAINAPAATLLVAKRDAGFDEGLRISMPQTDLWRRLSGRLVAKAEQARRSRASWIRLDALDGLWLLTPWGQSPLGVKVPIMASAVRSALGDGDHLRGVLISDGAATVALQRGDETVEADGSMGLRRQLDRWRARQAIIVPLRGDSDADVELWISLYESEPDWLDWALDAASLPFPNELHRGTA